MDERLCICGCGDPAKPRYLYAKRHKSNPVPKPELPDPNPSGLCMCGCGETTSIASRTTAKMGYYKGRHRKYRRGHGGRLRFAEDTSRWKGGVIVTGEGYVKRRVTRDGERRYVLDHRLVMEEMLGRRLEPSEQVHHINGNKQDNRPENLELWQRSQPPGVRSADYHCPGCRCSE